MLCSLEAKRYEERFAMSFNLILIAQLNKEKKKDYFPRLLYGGCSLREKKNKYLKLWAFQHIAKFYMPSMGVEGMIN